MKNAQNEPAVLGPVERPVRPLCDRLRDWRGDPDEVMGEAAEKLDKLDALLRDMQADAVRYLVPDNNCGAEWFVSRMLSHLDGPKQREAQDGVRNG